jgi:serine/threonine protein kinase
MGGEYDETSEPERPLAVGKLLAGRYRIQRLLGEGGMARVYEGEHVAIGKRVAIKIVQSLFATDDEIVHRFEREARSASAVESEHIVHVFDVGNDPELGLFLVMELLNGEDLARVLHERGPLDPAFACGLLRQAALGLEKAHAAGIIHRDLKPANVFLVERDDGTTLVKLVDFGIAKVVREARDARLGKRGITRSGTAVGTPQYMSPEQAQGLETVDHRTDVFSLGAVLFEVIAGRSYLPERPTYEQTILQLVSTDAPRLRSVAPHVPPALDDLVAGMLDRDVDRRVQSMRVVRERIDAAFPELRGSSVRLKSLPPSKSSVPAHSGPPVASPTFPATAAAVVSARSVRMRRSIVAVAGLAVVVGVIVGITAMVNRSTDPASTAAATVGTPAQPPPGTGAATSVASLSPPPTGTATDTPPAASSSARASAGRGAHKAPTGGPPTGAPNGAQTDNRPGAAGISSQF